MFNFIFFFLSRSSLFGIDLGYENIRLGMSTFQGIQIIGNQQSKKLSPSYMAIWNYYYPANYTPLYGHWDISDLKNLTWDFLDRAKTHSIRYPQNSIKSFWPLLNKSVGLEHREALALTLRHLISTCENGRYHPTDTQFAVAVEPSLSRYERIALIEAFNLSGATLNYIIDTPYATAHLFALEKNRQYIKQPKTVAFVDIGAHGSWIAVYNFDSASKTISNVKEIALVTTNEIGGFHIDNLLVNYLLKKFEEKTNLKPDSPRVLARLREEVKKAKESLSLNKDVSIFIEELANDQDLSYHLTREEFNSLMGDFNKTLINLVKDTLAKVGKKKIHSVEAIGGTSRVPFIREILAREFGVEELSRTMNPDESVALGASYLSATRSSSMRFPLKIVAKVRPHTDVFLHIGDKKIPIFDEKSFTDKKVNQEYTAKDVHGKELILTSDNDERPLVIFKFDENETVNDSAVVSIQFGFNQLSIPYVSKATINDVPANVTYINPNWTFSEHEFGESFNFITQLQHHHYDRAEGAKIRSEFEGFIANSRDKLEYNKTYTSIMTENETLNITEALNEQLSWLENISDPLTGSDFYKERFDKFKTIFDPIDDRWEQIEKVPSLLETLNKTIEKVRKFYYEEAPKEKPWLFTHFNDTMNNLLENLESYTNQYHEFVANFSAWNRTCPLSFRHNQVNVADMILNFNYKNILKNKKPTPTPVPTPVPEGYNPENSTSSNGTAFNISDELISEMLDENDSANTNSTEHVEGESQQSSNEGETADSSNDKGEGSPEFEEDKEL